MAMQHSVHLYGRVVGSSLFLKVPDHIYTVDCSISLYSTRGVFGVLLLHNKDRPLSRLHTSCSAGLDHRDSERKDYQAGQSSLSLSKKSRTIIIQDRKTAKVSRCWTNRQQCKFFHFYVPCKHQLLQG
jgi:hypothetical protein